MSRFTAEFRGVDSIDEWCVIDEDVGFTGCVFVYGIDEPTAKALADLVNYLYEEIQKIKTVSVKV